MWTQGAFQGLCGRLAFGKCWVEAGPTVGTRRLCHGDTLAISSLIAAIQPRLSCPCSMVTFFRQFSLMPLPC